MHLQQFILAYAIMGGISAFEENLLNSADSWADYNPTEDSTELLGLSLTIPQIRANIKNLRFMLYTRKNKEHAYAMALGNESNLNGSPFNKGFPTKIIVHGWQGSFDSEHIQSLKNALLKTYDANVMIFDYKIYNRPYIAAVSRSESIGKHFAEFVNFLMLSSAIGPRAVHIIGHSLGGHIAGFIGKNVHNKVARITGLDPAGLFFFDSKPGHRLDRNDAHYVDVIHTSTLAGINAPIGDADFFVNGGSKQPVCATSTIAGGCDHLAAFIYYEATLTNRSAFPARRCKTEEEARTPNDRENPCIASLAVMGEDAIKRSPPGIYYVPMD